MDITTALLDIEKNIMKKSIPKTFGNLNEMENILPNVKTDTWGYRKPK